MYMNTYVYTYIKGKAIPLQARSGPAGARKLMFPYYVTMAHDGGMFSAFTPRKYS